MGHGGYMVSKQVARTKKIPDWFNGCIIGALVWLYDYDFLLNAGGPETPISDTIRSFFKVDYSDIYFPLFLLMAVGSIIGTFIGLLRKHLFRHKEQ